MAEAEHNGADNRKMFRFLSGLMIVVTIVICAWMVKAYLEGKFNSVESFQGYIAQFGSFGPVFLTVVQALQVVLPVLPGFLGCAVGAIMFGPFVGFLCNYIGIGGGSIIAFLLARKYGMPLVQSLFPKEKYTRWAEKLSQSKSYAAFLFLAMLLPLFPDDFLCYLTGVTKMSVKRFTAIICLGKPWCLLAYSFGFALMV